MQGQTQKFMLRPEYKQIFLKKKELQINTHIVLKCFGLVWAKGLKENGPAKKRQNIVFFGAKRGLGYLRPPPGYITDYMNHISLLNSTITIICDVPLKFL